MGYLIMNKRKEEKLKKAYVEVLSFLKIIKPEEYNKIPHSFIAFLEENRNHNYSKVVYKNVPIKKQKLMPETLDIIAFLNLKYFCKSEDEKEELISAYKMA